MLLVGGGASRVYLVYHVTDICYNVYKLYNYSLCLPVFALISTMAMVPDAAARQLAEAAKAQRLQRQLTVRVYSVYTAYAIQQSAGQLLDEIQLPSSLRADAEGGLQFIYLTYGTNQRRGARVAHSYLDLFSENESRCTGSTLHLPRHLTTGRWAFSRS